VSKYPIPLYTRRLHSERSECNDPGLWHFECPYQFQLNCGVRQIVFFGLDTRGNAINPLPSGGSLILASAFSYAINGGYDHELDLDFRFVPGAPAPTELIFAIEGSDWRQLGLGTNLPGF
jgi:hypothetical protein